MDEIRESQRTDRFQRAGRLEELVRDYEVENRRLEVRVRRQARKLNWLSWMFFLLALSLGVVAAPLYYDSWDKTATAALVLGAVSWISSWFGAE